MIRDSEILSIYQRRLRELFTSLLHNLHPLVQKDVLTVLSSPGKLLSVPLEETDPSLRPGVWPLLTLLMAHHLNPASDIRVTGTVALTLECTICALDLLDDVEDDDDTPVLRTLRAGRALNVSTALLFLGQSALSSLLFLGKSEVFVQRLRVALEEALLRATAGQHKDLLAEEQTLALFPYEECLEIAKEKSGTLIRLACLLGALSANADEEMCLLVAAFGEQLGIAYQLDNDVHDLFALLHPPTRSSLTRDGEPFAEGSPTASIKSDLLRGKKTLPIVLATTQFAPDQGQHSLPVPDQQDQRLQRALDKAIVTTWSISELYRQQAATLLHEIEERSTAAPLLRLLLDLL